VHGQDAFNAAFFGFLDRLFLIASFGEVAGAGLGAAQAAAAPKYAGLASGLLKGRAFAVLTAKPGDLEAPALPERWVESAVKAAMARAKPTVDASCFVYAHTLLEALAVDCAAALGKPFARDGSVASAAEALAERCPGSAAPDLKLLAGLDAAREGAVRGRPVPDPQKAVADVLTAALALTQAAAAAGRFRLDPAALLAKPRR
jgi:hypothetical protein